MKVGEGRGFRHWMARGASLWYPFQTWVSGFLQSGVFLAPSYPPLAPLPFFLVNFLSDLFPFLYPLFQYLETILSHLKTASKTQCMLVLIRRHIWVLAPLKTPSVETVEGMQCRAVQKKQFFSQRPLHLIKPACHQDTGLLFVFQFGPAPIAQLPPIQFVPKLPYLPLTGLDTWGNMLHLLPLVFVNLLTSLATPPPCLVAPKKEKENPDSQPDIHGTRVPASAVSLACLILVQLHWTPQLPQAVIPSPPSLKPSPNILPCV